MRAVLLASCLLLCASAAMAGSPTNQALPPQCHNLDMQIVHYQTLRARADAVNSTLWEQRLDAQIKALNDQRKVAGCPSNSTAAQMAAQLRELLRLAAQGALTFFTMGAM